MAGSAHRRATFAVVLVLIVIGLEALGYRILGSVGDLIAMSAWTVLATLVAIGLATGRLVERAIRSRDLQRQGRSS